MSSEDVYKNRKGKLNGLQIKITITETKSACPRSVRNLASFKQIVV